MNRIKIHWLLLMVILCLAGCEASEPLKKGPVLIGIAEGNVTWSYYEQTETLVLSGHGKIPREFCSSLYFQHTLRHLILEEGITQIGLSAFERCASLESVSFPESLKIVDGSAFYECTSLKKVIFPEGVVIVGMRAFKGCTALTKVVLPETVSQIHPQVFEECPNLTDVTVPSHLEEWAKANGFRE